MATTATMQQEEEEQAYQALQQGLALLQQGQLEVGFKTLSEVSRPGSPSAKALRRRSIRSGTDNSLPGLDEAIQLVGKALAQQEQDDTSPHGTQPSPPSHQRRSSYGLQSSGKSALSNLGSMYKLLTETNPRLPETASHLTVQRHLDESLHDGLHNTGVVEVTCIFTRPGSLGLKLQKYHSTPTDPPPPHHDYAAQVCSIHPTSMAKEAHVPLHSLVAGVNSRSTKGMHYKKVMETIKKAAAKRPLTIIFRHHPDPPQEEAVQNPVPAPVDNHSKLNSLVQQLQQPPDHSGGFTAPVPAAVATVATVAAAAATANPPAPPAAAAPPTPPKSAVAQDRQALQIIDYIKQLTFYQRQVKEMEVEVAEAKTQWNDSLRRRHTTEQQHIKVSE